MVVTTVTGPLGSAGPFVQVTVNVTSSDEAAPTAHELPKSSTDGDGDLVTVQTWSLPCEAVIVLLMVCGAGVSGIDTRFSPMPCEPSAWLARFDWSEEPENADDPSASRWK